MQEGRDHKSINIKIAIIYFSILVGIQAVTIILLLRHPSLFIALLAGLGISIALPVVLGVAILSAVKMKYGAAARVEAKEDGH